MHIDTSIDHHVHTRLCHHGTGEMEEYVIAAVQYGLSTLQFLEHMEEQVSYFESTWLTENDFNYYFEEGRRLQQKYSHQIAIKLGVEVGFNPASASKLLSRINSLPFDAVGISCHSINHPTSDNDLNLFSRKEQNRTAIETAGRDEVLTEYFTRLITAVKVLPGSMVCHLDGALRHLPELTLRPAHLELIDTLLKNIREKEMMLEINASGFKMRQEPFPARWIVKKALQYGIRLAASSDAHKPADVGRYFDRLPSYIESCLV